MRLPRDAPALQKEIGIVQLARLAHRRPADRQRGAIGAIARQRRDLRQRRLHEGRLHDQVLRLVAGHEHLGQRDEIGAGVSPRAPRVPRLFGISGEVSDRRVELRQGHAKAFGHCGSFLRIRP